MLDKTKETFISIVIPVLNEEENIFRAYSAINEELSKIDNFSFEMIFTDNHSTDGTFANLEKLAAKDDRVKVLRFARNFGFNRSILEGYRRAAGEAAIQIDCDLEDPPSVMHDFIGLWREGYDVVVGVRTNRKEGFVMIYLRKAFYIFLNKISQSNHQVDAGDFRLVDRSVLNQLAVINDAEPYVRGLISELASNQGSVTYSRDRREFGESKFPLRRLVTLALDAIFAHSTLPLKVASYVGLLIAGLTALLTAGYIIARLISPGVWPAGFATTTVLILFGISLNALFLGIIGEYIARIHRQVRNRPNVVVQKSLNLEKNDMKFSQGEQNVL